MEAFGEKEREGKKERVTLVDYYIGQQSMYARSIVGVRISKYHQNKLCLGIKTNTR